jgi:hypothetical protein
MKFKSNDKKLLKYTLVTCEWCDEELNNAMIFHSNDQVTWTSKTKNKTVLYGTNKNPLIFTKINNKYYITISRNMLEQQNKYHTYIHEKYQVKVDDNGQMYCDYICDDDIVIV